MMYNDEGRTPLADTVLDLVNDIGYNTAVYHTSHSSAFTSTRAILRAKELVPRGRSVSSRALVLRK